MKLGKLAARADTRTLRLARYLTPALPAPPVAVDWTRKVVQPWGMCANDVLGDCTIAAAAHMIDCWTANAGHETVIQTPAVLAAYSSFCGYNPADPTTDCGGVEVDVLNGWRQTGIGGHKIEAYAAVSAENFDHVRQAISLFGGLYLGLMLPAGVQGAASWDAPPSAVAQEWSPGSWGGHAVPAIAYDAVGLTVITWGAPLNMTWDFFKTYCDEAYAIISPDFLGGANETPGGFDLASLQADLALVTG